MLTTLNDIFDLEDRKQFYKAFDAYQKVYDDVKPDYQIWKHYYFLLWNLIEEATSAFSEKRDLRKLLQQTFEVGQNNFSDNADFNFIAGYTVSIFPYEYGDYTNMETISSQMLLKATQLQPDNAIFKMCYLGSQSNADKTAYEKSIIDAAPKVLETFSGKGCLNSYFKQVLYRIDEMKNYNAKT